MLFLQIHENVCNTTYYIQTKSRSKTMTHLFIIFQFTPIFRYTYEKYCEKKIISISTNKNTFSIRISIPENSFSIPRNQKKCIL